MTKVFVINKSLWQKKQWKSEFYTISPLSLEKLCHLFISNDCLTFLTNSWSVHDNYLKQFIQLFFLFWMLNVNQSCRFSIGNKINEPHVWAASQYQCCVTVDAALHSYILHRRMYRSTCCCVCIAWAMLWETRWRHVMYRAEVVCEVVPHISSH